jgi:hypothetical protein
VNVTGPGWDWLALGMPLAIPLDVDVRFERWTAEPARTVRTVSFSMTGS